MDDNNYNNNFGGDNPQQNNQQPYGQPDYTQQNNYQQPYNQPNYTQQYPSYNDAQFQYNKNDGKAIASLVLGIVGLVFFCCGACFFCSIPGLILGIVSKKGRPQNNGMAIAGIVLSAIGIAVFLYIIFYIIMVGVNVTAYSDLLGNYYSYY